MLLGLLLSLCPPAALAPSAPLPAESEIPRLVRELGDDNFQARERAGELLKELGIVARPALLAAARSKDPEIRFRAAALLSQMTWFTREDPEEVRKQLALYNRLPARDRIELVVSWLIRADDASEKETPLDRRIPALVRILRFEEDGEVCRAVATALESLVLLTPPERAQAVAVLIKAAPAEPRATGDWLVKFCAAAADPVQSSLALDRAVREERARLRSDPGLSPSVLLILLEKRHARLAAAGKADQAGADLVEVVKLDPKPHRAALQLMEWHLLRGEWAPLEALRARLPAAAADPRALYLAGKARERQGDKVGAEALYKQALAVEPDKEHPHYLLGDFLIRRDWLEPAQAEFRRVHELKPDGDAYDFSAHVLLCDGLARSGRFAAAAAAAEAAAGLLEPRLARNDDRFFHLPVWTLSALRAKALWMKIRAAPPTGGALPVEAMIRDLVALAPGDSTTAAELHNWLKEKKRLPEADAVLARTADYFRDLAKREENNPAPANALAWLLARTGTRLDEALEQARRAAMLAPGGARYWDTLAEVCFRRNEPAKAVRFARRAVELDPADAFFREQLARFEKAM